MGVKEITSLIRLSKLELKTAISWLYRTKTSLAPKRGYALCVSNWEVKSFSVQKNAKRELGQYPAILTELAWSIKDLLYGIKNTEKMILVLVYFRALKRKPVVICKSDVLFSFSLTLSVSSFSSSIPTEKSQKIFLLPRKIFCKRKLSCFGEILLREQNGQSRAGSIGPSCPLE